MQGPRRRAVAAATTLMIVLGMTAIATPASGAPVPDHIVLSPDPFTIVAGDTRTYSAEGFDAADMDLGDVTVDTTFSIDPPGSCAGADCGSTTAGDYTVTGTDGSATDTATLQVDPGPLDHIVISPSTSSIAAGGTETYHVDGFDSFNNSLGDITGSISFSIDTPGSCSGAICGSTVPGDYVVTGTATGTISDTAMLHVSANPPSITSFSPDSGKVRAAVVITGANLTGTSTVRFNGTPALVYTINSDTKITATVPMGAKTGKISLTATGGSTSSVQSFAVKPTISRFKRLSGRSGSRVVIRGSAFTGTTSVTFNKTKAKFHVATYKRIIAIVPLKATSGRIRVRTHSGRASSTTGFRVKPRVTRFSPTAGRVGSSVVISGSGFSKVWKVTINGKEAAFRVVSSIKIVATVPRVKTGPIRVRTAFGGSVSSTNFRVV